MICTAYQKGTRWGDIDIVGGGMRCKQGLAGKLEEIIKLGRPRHNRADNIRKDFKLIS
jgi:hypothetical protein